MRNKILSKLNELAQQRERLLAQLNAIIGAEQALNQLLETDASADTDQAPIKEE